MLGAAISVLIFNSLRDGSISNIIFRINRLLYLGKPTLQGELASYYMSIWCFGYEHHRGFIGQAGYGAHRQKEYLPAFGCIVCLVEFRAVFSATAPTWLTFLLNVLIGISAGIVLPIIWSMYADIADYSE